MLGISLLQYIHKQSQAAWSVISIEQLLAVLKLTAFVPHFARCVGQIPLRQQRQKVDGVEQVRLSNPIGAEHASERTKADVEVQQILESRDLEACEQCLQPI